MRTLILMPFLLCLYTGWQPVVVLDAVLYRVVFNKLNAKNAKVFSNASRVRIIKNLRAAVTRGLHTKLSPFGCNLVLQGQEARREDFSRDLAKCLIGDKHLWELVDKTHPLSRDYVPQDLVTLKAGPYRLNVQGIKLRKAAADSLVEMAAAARVDGVTLTVTSAYRSYSYQQQVYSRIVRERGQRAADRVSARPGHSQHQTGLAVDFAPLDNSFAKSAAGRWMATNAYRFGWSLSYPEGHEALTGYQWESWHYRYVGKELASFIEKHFGGLQQKALVFIGDYEKDR